MCGDFNSHNSIWGSNKTDKNGREIEEFLTDNNLVFLNDGTPTRQDPSIFLTSCIDLTIVTRNLSSKCNWSVNNQILSSDHFLISIDIILQKNNPTTSNGTQFLQNWSYQKANWDKYKDILNNVVYETFDNNVQKMYDNFIIPWWNKDCKVAIKNRNKAKRKVTKSMMHEDLLDYKEKKK